MQEIGPVRFIVSDDVERSRRLCTERLVAPLIFSEGVDHFGAHRIEFMNTPLVDVSTVCALRSPSQSATRARVPIDSAPGKWVISEPARRATRAAPIPTNVEIPHASSSER